MRVHTSLRRLVGLAVAGLAVIAPAPALAHGGGAVFTETNASANAVQAYAQAGDGTLTPAATYPTGGAGTGCRRPGLRGRARPRSRLAARRERRLERRLGLPRARHASRARRTACPRAARRRTASRSDDGIAYVLNTRRHRQHQRLQAHPPRPRPAERRHAAAVVGHGRRRAGLVHARAATSSSSRRRAPTRSSPTPSTAGAAREPARLTPRPAPRRSASRSASTTRCS